MTNGASKQRDSREAPTSQSMLLRQQHAGITTACALWLAKNYLACTRLQVVASLRAVEEAAKETLRCLLGERRSSAILRRRP